MPRLCHARLVCRRRKEVQTPLESIASNQVLQNEGCSTPPHQNEVDNEVNSKMKEVINLNDIDSDSDSDSYDSDETGDTLEIADAEDEVNHFGSSFTDVNGTALVPLFSTTLNNLHIHDNKALAIPEHASALVAGQDNVKVRKRYRAKHRRWYLHWKPNKRCEFVDEWYGFLEHKA